MTPLRAAPPGRSTTTPIEAATEREDKYDVGLAFAVPDLATVVPGGHVALTTEHLESTYFDTADRDLLARNFTLRRRTGSTDTGWQLKVPAGLARTELRLPPTGGTGVPAELADLLLAARAAKELRPVAIVKVTRTIHRVCAADRVLAEIADDDVHATALGTPATARRWREVEVELENGDEPLLAAVGARLRQAGARPSKHRSKLARTLGEPPPAPKPRTRTAGAVVLAYLRAQRDVLVSGDFALRRGDAPIHDTRVAVRRLRSTLRTFGALFDPGATETLDVELGWLGQLLGEVRDREVLRAHLADTLAGVPPELVLGPVAARIEEHLHSAQLRHHGDLLAAMSGNRYGCLIAALDGWIRTPPCTAAAGKPPEALLAIVARADRKATKRLRAALGPGGDDPALHRARKAAKRARYAAELAADVPTGKSARKELRRRVKALNKRQEVLGDQHDSVEAAALLRELGIVAGNTPGENGFTYGLLYEHERTQGAQARATAAQTLEH